MEVWEGVEEAGGGDGPDCSTQVWTRSKGGEQHYMQSTEPSANANLEPTNRGLLKRGRNNYQQAAVQ